VLLLVLRDTFTSWVLALNNGLQMWLCAHARYTYACLHLACRLWMWWRHSWKWLMPAQHWGGPFRTSRLFNRKQGSS